MRLLVKLSLIAIAVFIVLYISGGTFQGVLELFINALTAIGRALSAIADWIAQALS